MLLSTITAGTLPPRIATRRANGRSDGTDDDDHQGEVLEAAEPCGEALRSEKEVIKAQYSAAEAQVRIGEAATGIGDQMADTGAAIQRARDKTEEMQSRADAIDELTASGALEDFTSDQTPLDRELAQMASESQVEEDLAKLKKEVGSGAPAGQKEIEK